MFVVPGWRRSDYDYMWAGAEEDCCCYLFHRSFVKLVKIQSVDAVLCSKDQILICEEIETYYIFFCFVGPCKLCELEV